MIARLVLVVAGIAAAVAGAAAWAKRRATQDEALEQEMLEVVTEQRDEPVAADADAPSSGNGEDDLQAIKGIGSVSAERLAGIGVTSFAQIAAWSPEDIDGVSAQISVSEARIKREDWVGQARALTGS